jgi:glyoxylase-like metal-dependent hydrolase (beta-lactamase superfamily II)
MIVRRSMHANFLSNAYLVADEPGGVAVFIDTGAPIEPLLAAVTELGVTVTQVLNTHGHHDHTIFNVELMERYDVPLHDTDDLADGQIIETGGLRIVARSTPGHTTEHLAFVVNDSACFSGDVLFAGAVGGTLGGGANGCADLRSSIMDTCMSLDHATVVYPGHTEATTIGTEWETNPFIRVWRGLDPEGAEPVQVNGTDGQLVLWAGDYDGGHKGWVRFADGREAIVGGSMIERLSPA